MSTYFRISGSGSVGKSTVHAEKRQGGDRERQSQEGRWYICIHSCPTSSYLRVRHRSEYVATTDTAHPTESQQSYRKQKSSSIRSMSDAPPSLIARDSPPRRELRSTDRTSSVTLIHCPRVSMVPL